MISGLAASPGCPRIVFTVPTINTATVAGVRHYADDAVTMPTKAPKPSSSNTNPSSSFSTTQQFRGVARGPTVERSVGERGEDLGVECVGDVPAGSDEQCGDHDLALGWTASRVV